MTFDEAKKKKESLPDTYEKDDREYEYLVVPELNNDISKFLEYLLIVSRDEDLELKDEDAIRFSSNKQFLVSGYWTDGIDVMLDDENF